VNREKDGYIYSFTGLRGDAKNLYKKIISGEDQRSKLVKAISSKEQLVHVQEADIVIWACGY
jgi:hypothetical protein